MSKFRILTLLLVLALALGAPASALAKEDSFPLHDDEIVFGGTYTLGDGEILDGNLIVFGGVVTIGTDAQVLGDVALFGGTITVDGVIHGEFVALGGVVTLEQHAVVQGDFIAPGSAITRDEQAIVLGEVVTETQTVRVVIPEVTQIQPDSRVEFGAFPERSVFDAIRVGVSPLVEMLWFLFRAFSFAALAVLLVMFIPEPTRRAAQAVVDQPVLAGGIGLLTVFGALATSFILLFTIILIPVSALLIFVLGLALAFGWIALGLEIGKRVMEASHNDWTPAIQAGVGTFLLTFVVGSIGSIFWDFFGVLAVIALAAIGLGGVTLTRFGAQAYSRALAAPAVAPAAPAVQQPAPKKRAPRKKSG